MVESDRNDLSPRTVMPPRWLCVGIIAFWLTTMGWLVWSEVRDELAPDEPPPYVIDLVDEAQPELAHIRWVVWVGDERQDTARFSGTTWIEHHEREDEFTLHFRLDPGLTGSGRIDLGLVKLKRMESEYRVDREGRLVSAVASFDLDVGTSKPSVRLEGAVHGGEFRGKYVVDTHTVLGSHEVIMDPVPVSRRASVLLPMHPVNKIGRLRPGQTWKMPLVDPLTGQLGGAHNPRTLRGRVLHEPQLLPPVPKNSARRAKPIRCLVIEYETDDEKSPKPRTWVRAADGLVVQQEASFGDRRLVMQRDMIPELAEER
jgi:hypothetical protein